MKRDGLTVLMMLCLLTACVVMAGCKGKQPNSITVQKDTIQESPSNEAEEDNGKNTGDEIEADKGEEKEDGETEQEEGSVSADGEETVSKEPDSGSESARPNVTIERVGFSDSYENEEGITLHSWSCYLPQVIIEGNPQASAEINRVFEHRLAEAERQNEEMKQDAESVYHWNVEDGNADFFESFRDDVDYSVEFIGEHLLSLYVSEYYFAGGAHPSYVIIKYDFDLDTGELLNGRQDPYSALSDDTTEFLAFLDKKMIEYLSQEREGCATIEDLFPEYQRSVFEVISANWSVHDGQIWICFNQYDIAPYVAGILDIPVSLEESEPYLSDYGKQLILP